MEGRSGKLILGYYPTSCWMDRKKTKTSVKIGRLQTKIWTQELTKMKQDVNT